MAKILGKWAMLKELCLHDDSKRLVVENYLQASE
jgi:hypothetical protein